MTQPIACDLHGATAVFTKTFPSGFIAFDPLILYRPDNLEISKLLSGQIMLQLMLSASAGSCFAGTKTIRTDGHGVSTLATAEPLCF